MRNRKRKKRAFFVPFILSEGTFFNIYFISMYSVLNTLSENTCFYISTILRHRLFLLVFKIVESLQGNLKRLSIIRTADSVIDLQRFLSSSSSKVSFLLQKCIKYQNNFKIKIWTILSLFLPFGIKLAKLWGTLDFNDFIWILNVKPLVWCSDMLI